LGKDFSLPNLFNFPLACFSFSGPRGVTYATLRVTNR
jgi:hypothetical protein